MGMIRKIWLQQPMAFARVGISPNPLAAFRWTDPDLRPRGTGRTTIAPAPTFALDADGAMRRIPDSEFTLFKDEYGIRPVCPFFELHGEYDGRKTDSTVLTEEILRECGLSLAQVSWSIHHANHKAYSLTSAEGDRVEARLAVRGDDHGRRDLIGSSPVDAPNPLVPATPGIKMGAVQIVRPTSESPAIGLRFFAPAGHAYAPSDIQKRLSAREGPIDWIIALFKLNSDWDDFALPKERCFLNPQSAWPGYRFLTYGQILRALPRVLSRPRAFFSLFRHVQRSELLRFVLGPTGNAGKLPPGLFASCYGHGAILASLGLIDDLGDGIITCEVDGVGVARARIAVGPPHFAPDRRPPVSIADVLTDLTRRAEVRIPAWSEGANWAMTENEMHDLLDRAYETAALSNLDAWVDELRSENESDAIYRNDPETPPHPDKLLWHDLSTETVLDLPLSEHARWRHRRNSAFEFFEQLVRDSPHLMKHWIRDPSEPRSLYYDKRMPALMRGADRRPLHLTRRQLAQLRQWIERLRASDPEKPS